MVILRAFCLVIGILGLLMGLLWIGQGLGLVMWPSSSFMLANRVWAINGTVLAIASAVAIYLSRRR
jgi:membrane protein implicated in regulation of membrane protease activity